jgi:predicted CXXCH cytochrome family protein
MKAKGAVVVSCICVIGLILACGFVTYLEASPYDAEIKPLTTPECGQCHFSYFKAIKNEGGKHQIDCVECHQVFHAYNPTKQNFAQIMPKCASCHQNADGGPFHGSDARLVPCLACHTNPHTPLNIPMGDVETACSLCHVPQNAEIQNYPSKHTTDVSCADCHHDKHGLIPACSECHENPSPKVELNADACMKCHPVHKPTEILYMKNTDSLICAGCHGDVYGMLQKNQTKHTFVTCADCHPSHGEIPLCSRCHGEPHPKMKIDTTNCGQCHGIAHDLQQ